MSKERKTSGSPADADLEVLRNAPPTQFDGHTEFQRLTPIQRLAWLDEAVAFITLAKSTKRVSVYPAEAPNHPAARSSPTAGL